MSAVVILTFPEEFHSRRLNSSAPLSPPPPPPPSPPPSGAAKLTNRRLISLHGEEAPKFLQGIITNNVRAESRSGLYAAFLTAPGKVLHDVFIYPTLGSQWHSDSNKDDTHGYLVEVDADQAESLLKHIKKHKLRSKFKLRMVEEGELDVWSVWREDDRWTAHSQGSPEDGTVGLTDCRAPGMGQRLLLPQASAGSGLPAELKTDEAPLSAYTIRRYLRGVPEGQHEIPRDDALPMNHSIDIMGGIDFKKGCYIGQELTIRTHHTGVVRRRILPIALYPHSSQPPEKLLYSPDAVTDASALEHGTDIRRDDKRQRSTGKLIASIGNIGLGMCRLEQMSDLLVSGEGSSFSPDDRFLVQTSQDGQVGIKAFVPDWMRGRIREPKLQRRVE
ncbi:Aminomethyltransferase folate-binding domain-containing protein [Teratosphaeria nubilosa]|uniref:Iron-sulfur cluster assembly factor IBA57 homolog, mitochondrial n=1 Tax=Teratosphaeria nubilosa TaxID=161662 RepID=A0A6G1LMG9_9PEZI|nr:Aminomethyltransferase folate-binding domain-containing protein [Teratosphaeria nubilosa]